MTDRNSSSSDVLSALPHRRPHRRSDKRAARPAVAKTAPPSQRPPTPGRKPKPASSGQATKPTPATRPGAQAPAPARPAGRSPSIPRRSRAPVPSTGADVIGTAVHAAAELAEIGLTAGARALRNAVARLPKP